MKVERRDSLNLMTGMRQVAGITVLWATSILAFPQHRSGGCLKYEPTVVRLTGTFVRKTFPGPPEYEDVRKGDRPEIYWLLRLPSPICVDESDPEIDTGKRDIREIQLVFLN